MAAAAAYEEQRRRHVEENKRRIEELGLRHLAAAAIPPQAKQLSTRCGFQGPPPPPRPPLFGGPAAWPTSLSSPITARYTL